MFDYMHTVTVQRLDQHSPGGGGGRYMGATRNKMSIRTFFVKSTMVKILNVKIKFERYSKDCIFIQHIL